MKRTISSLIVTILLFSNVFICQAQELKIRYPLTNDNMEEAINVGFDRKRCGLYLKEQWKSWCGWRNSGFSLWILTPYGRICNAAYEAQREYLNFSRKDVTKEMLLPYVLIIVYPNMPRKATIKNFERAQGIEHVVLADTKKTLIIHPSALELFDQEKRMGNGVVVTYKGAYVEFTIEDILRVSRKDFRKKGEFIIKVIGVKSEKEFKIKGKYLQHLK
jgi:hypothetical protein